MAKRRGKRRPVDMVDGGNNAAGGSAERYLMPGTIERERMLQMQEDLLMQDESLDTPIMSKEEKKEGGQVEIAYQGSEQGVRNYRNFMKKYEQAKETHAMIEEGLGHSVPKSDLNDELYDPSVSAADFKKEAVIDHAAEFEAKREVPTVDTNGDGKIDEQDVVMTPGMKRMARYM